MCNVQCCYHGQFGIPKFEYFVYTQLETVKKCESAIATLSWEWSWWCQLWVLSVIFDGWCQSCKNRMTEMHIQYTVVFKLKIFLNFSAHQLWTSRSNYRSRSNWAGPSDKERMHERWFFWCLWFVSLKKLFGIDWASARLINFINALALSNSAFSTMTFNYLGFSNKVISAVTIGQSTAHQGRLNVNMQSAKCKTALPWQGSP